MDEKPVKQPSKLLITGASGFTGIHACRHFLKEGYDVIAVTKKSAHRNMDKSERCDLTDRTAVSRLVNKIKPQYVLHLAGQNHVRKSWADPVCTLEANLLTTLYLIDALRRENPDCKIIVIGSALQIDPKNIHTLAHPYGLSKTLQVLTAQAWEILYNMNIVIANPSNLIGPGFSNGICSILAKKIVEMEENQLEKVLEVDNLNARRDFIDVRDAVHAYEVLFLKGKQGEIYEIASGKSYSLEEIIKDLRTLTNVNFEIRTKISIPEKEVENNCEKINNLGWNPSIPVKSSLNDILNFYRTNKFKK